MKYEFYNIEELKQATVEFAVEGLIEELEFTREEALKRVKESRLEEMVEKVPDIIGHYSKSQLVYDIAVRSVIDEIIDINKKIVQHLIDNFEVSKEEAEQMIEEQKLTFYFIKHPLSLTLSYIGYAEDIYLKDRLKLDKDNKLVVKDKENTIKTLMKYYDFTEEEVNKFLGI